MRPPRQERCIRVGNGCEIATCCWKRAATTALDKHATYMSMLIASASYHRRVFFPQQPFNLLQAKWRLFNQEKVRFALLWLPSRRELLGISHLVWTFPSVSRQCLDRNWTTVKVCLPRWCEHAKKCHRVLYRVFLDIIVKVIFLLINTKLLGRKDFSPTVNGNGNSLRFVKVSLNMLITEEKQLVGMESSQSMLCTSQTSRNLLFTKQVVSLIAKVSSPAAYTTTVTLT